MQFGIPSGKVLEIVDSERYILCRTEGSIVGTMAVPGRNFMIYFAERAKSAQSLGQKRSLLRPLHWIRTPITIPSIEIGPLFC